MTQSQMHRALYTYKFHCQSPECKLMIYLSCLTHVMSYHVTLPSSLRCADGLVPTNALCLLWCVAD